MELKKGFKMTEVGKIPVDWEVKSYEDVFSFLSTANYSRAQLSFDEKISYIHYGDIHTKWHHHLDFDQNTLPAISDKQRKNYTLLKEGDIIMADASEDYEGIGKSVEVINLGNKEAISGLHTFLLRDKGFFIDKFRGYIGVNTVVKNQFDKYATGLKVYGVSKANLKKIQIPVPTVEEQTAIATALSDTDDLIRALDQLTAKKRAVKQGAMQRLLTPPSRGGQRLTGFSGEWEVKRLRDVVSFKNGKAHENAIDKNGSFIVINSKFVSTEGRVAKYSNSCLGPLDKEDIVMVMSDIPNGKAIAKCFFIIEPEKYTLNQRICALTITEGYSKFYFYLLNRNKYFLTFDDGVKQTNLRKDDILNCPIIIPAYEEQEEIAQILTHLDKEIQALETQRAKYQAVKQGMMQELLTGKTRLV